MKEDLDKEVWVMVDGTAILVRDMEEDHVRNAFAMVIRQIRLGNLICLGGHQERVRLAYALSALDGDLVNATSAGKLVINDSAIEAAIRAEADSPQVCLSRGFTADEAAAYSSFLEEVFHDAPQVCEWKDHPNISGMMLVNATSAGKLVINEEVKK